jgi:citrate lyase synthetase|tara:strand:- start:4407 stop:4787 length:381 start_codon:yes stop_codon:yes gene_type:complete
MISFKLLKNLSEKEYEECNNLINSNFKNNRINENKNVIIYTNNNEIIGFIGIKDNTLNQLCTSIEYRRIGVATKIIETAKKMLKGELILYIDKNKENTEYLLYYYDKKGFKIFEENNIEYKMIYKN